HIVHLPMRRPPRCTRFPYTTLFRSQEAIRAHCSVRSCRRLELAACRPSTTCGRGDVHPAWVRRDAHPFASQQFAGGDDAAATAGDRKSTRLNSSHVKISYAVFCLKK